MLDVVLTMLWSLLLILVPVSITPDGRASEVKLPSEVLSNVMVFSMPRVPTAASKVAAAAVEWGAVARDPAPSSAPVKRVMPAWAGAVTKARANAAMASITPLEGFCV